MTAHPAPAPQGAPRPAWSPAPATKAVAMPRVPWGWLEWFAISQTFVPALVFIPGVAPVRSVVRVASFVIALIAWVAIVAVGRPRPGAETFPAHFWLKASAGLLLLMILHPSGNSIQAAVAQVLLYLAVFSPAFWAPGALASPRQVNRLMAILLICNSAGALVGLGQVFRPSTFNPPVINFTDGAVAGDDRAGIEKHDLATDDGTGNKILRPAA